MKKLLSILGAVALTGCTTASAVACQITQTANDLKDFSIDSNLKMDNKGIKNKPDFMNQLNALMVKTLSTKFKNNKIKNDDFTINDLQVNDQPFPEDDIAISQLTGNLSFSITATSGSKILKGATSKLQLPLMQVAINQGMFQDIQYDNTIEQASFPDLFTQLSNHIAKTINCDYIHEGTNQDYTYVVKTQNTQVTIEPNTSEYSIHKLGGILNVKLVISDNSYLVNTGADITFQIKLATETLHMSQDDTRWQFSDTDNTIKIGDNYKTDAELQTFLYGSNGRYITEINQNLKAQVAATDLAFGGWKLDGAISDNNFSVTFNVSPSSLASKYQYVTGDSITVMIKINRDRPTIDDDTMPKGYFAQIDSPAVPDLTTLQTTLTQQFIQANKVKLPDAVTPKDLECNLLDKSATGPIAKTLADVQTWHSAGDTIYIQFHVAPTSKVLDNNSSNKPEVLSIAGSINNLQQDVFNQPLNLVNLAMDNTSQWQSALTQDIITAIIQNQQYAGVQPYLVIDVSMISYDDIVPNGQLQNIKIGIDNQKTTAWYGNVSINIAVDVSVTHSDNELKGFKIDAQQQTVSVLKSAYGLTSGDATHDMLDYNSLFQTAQYLIGSQITLRGLWIDQTNNLFWNLNESINKDVQYYKTMGTLPKDGATLVYATLRSDFTEATLEHNRTIIPWVFYTATIHWTTKDDIKIKLTNNQPYANEASNINKNFVYDVFHL